MIEYYSKYKIDFLALILGLFYLLFFPLISFASPPATFYNGESFTANCEVGATYFQSYASMAGSDYKNSPLMGTCGNTYTFYDSNPSPTYKWVEFNGVYPTGNFTLNTDFIILYEAPPVPPVPAPWGGSSNGFWGSTTASSIIDDIQASVITSGVNIYPLLTYVGIPILFFIAGLLIFFINKTLTPAPAIEKRKRGRPRKAKEDFIYHSAEDLAFRREFGSKK